MNDRPVFEYSTSHVIEVVAPNLLRKDLSDAGLIGSARTNRVPFLHDPRREPAIYTGLLRPLGIGPRCLVAGDDWLVLERVDGTPLWQYEDGWVWVQTARWLALMHSRLAAYRTTDLPFLVYDERIAGEWRKRTAAVGVPAELLEAHRRASARLACAERTIVHGELYPSNVLVRVDEDWSRGSSVTVWPVDWEVAGIGPGVLDVAALTAGRPSDSPIRTEMEQAYFHARFGDDGDWNEWCDDLRAARIAVCVQWLAQTPGWEAPLAHRRDWLAEARDLADAT